MKNILTTSLFFILCYLSGYSQSPTVHYNLIQNGTNIEVWAVPIGADPPATANVSAGNQVTIKSQDGSGNTISITSNVTGSWSKTVSNLGSDNLDYSIFVLSNDPVINPFENGTDIHLFTFTLDCDDGEIALMDNVNDDATAPNDGNNWGNSFSVVILSPYVQIGEIYDGNVSPHEISCLGGLPVELLSFSGQRTAEGNLLKWQTANEENNAGFEVQKSPNGLNWEVIAWIEGRGTSSFLNEYELLDRLPFIGNNYYRLKQIDYDNRFEFSETINIDNLESDITIKVLPNPSPGDVEITVQNPAKKRMNIILYDNSGQVVWKSETLNGVGLWRRAFHLTQKEVYFINVQIGSETFTEKILIIDKK